MALIPTVVPLSHSLKRGTIIHSGATGPTESSWRIIKEYRKCSHHITLCCECTILNGFNTHPPNRQSSFLGFFAGVFLFIIFLAHTKICNFYHQIFIQPKTKRTTGQCSLSSVHSRNPNKKFAYMQFLAAKSQ